MVLGLFLIIPSKADDIQDFQIEGISVGDSLLDYFSEEEINKKIEVLEIDETPAYGLETKLKIAISGVIECE